RGRGPGQAGGVLQRQALCGAGSERGCRADRLHRGAFRCPVGAAGVQAESREALAAAVRTCGRGAAVVRRTDVVPGRLPPAGRAALSRACRDPALRGKVAPPTAIARRCATLRAGAGALSARAGTHTILIDAQTGYSRRRL